MYPILIRPLGFPVYSYGVMLGLSIYLGWIVARHFAEGREGFSRQTTGALYLITIVAAMVGARGLYIATNLERFHSLRELIALNQGGLVVYGGFLGGFFGAWWMCRRQRVSVLSWGDASVPALGIGLFITRIGCLLYGCDYGQPWDGPWAVRFPPDSPAYINHRITGLLPEHATSSLPVHPSQVYESLVGLGLFFFTLWLWRRRRHRGEVFAGFTMAYAVLRFLLEFLRGDDQRGARFGFSTSQLIAMATFTAAAVLWVSLRRTPLVASTHVG